MKRLYPLTLQSGLSQSNSYILMLGESGTGTQIPLFIGAAEAQSILLAQEGTPTRRPLTHRLMTTLMQQFALTLTQVTIDRVSEGIFYATLHVSDGFNTQQIDSRASDAIALALMAGCPIYADEQVIEETGVQADPPAADAPLESRSLDELEEQLRRCEEQEAYEQAAVIQQEIERRRRQQ
ncbi:MAG: bifunctional nuclease family protein [Bacteroidales bacterium]|nr:bifunctional nuclease family protein [Bacteroidales bacterium]